MSYKPKAPKCSSFTPGPCLSVLTFALLPALRQLICLHASGGNDVGIGSACMKLTWSCILVDVLSHMVMDAIQKVSDTVQAIGVESATTQDVLLMLFSFVLTFLGMSISSLPNVYNRQRQYVRGINESGGLRKGANQLMGCRMLQLGEGVQELGIRLPPCSKIRGCQGPRELSPLPPRPPARPQTQPRCQIPGRLMPPLLQVWHCSCQSNK